MMFSPLRSEGLHGSSITRRFRGRNSNSNTNRDIGRGRIRTGIRIRRRQGLLLLFLLYRGSIGRRRGWRIGTIGDGLGRRGRDGRLQHRFLHLCAFDRLHDDGRLSLGLSGTPCLQRRRSRHGGLRVLRHGRYRNWAWRTRRRRSGVDAGRRTFPIVLLGLGRALSVLHRC